MNRITHTQLSGSVFKHTHNVAVALHLNKNVCQMWMQSDRIPWANIRETEKDRGRFGDTVEAKKNLSHKKFMIFFLFIAIALCMLRHLKWFAQAACLLPASRSIYLCVAVCIGVCDCVCMHGQSWNFSGFLAIAPFIAIDSILCARHITPISLFISINRSF